MLRAHYLADLDTLPWQPVGPGPDPHVLLDAAVRLNGAPYRFRAVRIFAPYSAGWTADDRWEMNPGDTTDEICWDSESLKLWVRICDHLPEEAETPPRPNPVLTPEMADLEEWWTQALDLFFWHDVDYAPALIEGGAYQIVGYPADEATDPAFSLDLPDTGWGNDTGEASFRDGVLLLQKRPYRLLGYEMLEVHGGSGSRNRARPINRKDSDFITEMSDFLQLPLTAGQLLPTPLAGSRYLLFAQPLRPLDYCIVADEAQAPSAPGVMRWHLPAVSDEVAAVAEALARLVRVRRMTWHEGRPLIIGNLEELFEVLPAFVHPVRLLPALRTASTLAAFGVGCRDCHNLHSEPLFQDASGSGAVFYVEPSVAGLQLLESLADEALWKILRRGGYFETPPLPMDADFPDWVKSLPPLFDRHYRDLWRSLSNRDED